MSVFVSVASYRDPVLEFTLCRALDTARWPERLHFGVVDQSAIATARLDPETVLPARLSYVRMEALDARGPCFARAIAMSLYDGEDWFLQIDSHMDFDPHWDERLIAQADSLLPGRLGVVLSSYPNPFVFEGGIVVRKPVTSKVLAHVVRSDASFEADHPVLGFEAHPVESDEPVPGFHVGAGCLFAPGALVHLVPYDPWYYFHGEEQAFAVRVFTHGWDIFHVPALPIHHLYSPCTPGAAVRPVHWDRDMDAQRPQAWHVLDRRSRRRLTSLLGGDALGSYGLGRTRTLQDFAAFSGIDYASRTLAPRAFRPLRPFRPAGALRAEVPSYQ